MMITKPVMMKKTYLFILPILIIVACNVDESPNEPINKNHNLIGTWNLTERFIFSEADSVTSDYSSNYTVDFMADGTMTKEDLSTITTYYWIENTSGSAYIIIREWQNPDGSVFAISDRLEVQTDEPDFQIWSYRNEYLRLPDSIFTTQEKIWTLERQ